MIAPASALALLSLSLMGCARQLVCEPPPPVNSDSIWHASGGPPRFVSDSTVPQDSIVVVVLDSVHGKPVIGAGARFLPAATLGARADSTGRMALPLPAGERAVLEVGALGFMRRRDTLELRDLQHRRMEVTLAYPTGGDIDVVVCRR